MKKWEDAKFEEISLRQTENWDHGMEPGPDGRDNCWNGVSGSKKPEPVPDRPMDNPPRWF